MSDLTPYKPRGRAFNVIVGSTPDELSENIKKYFSQPNGTLLLEKPSTDVGRPLIKKGRVRFEVKREINSNKKLFGWGYMANKPKIEYHPLTNEACYRLFNNTFKKGSIHEAILAALLSENGQCDINTLIQNVYGKAVFDSLTPNEMSGKKRSITTGIKAINNSLSRVKGRIVEPAILRYKLHGRPRITAHPRLEQFSTFYLI